jgi:hypothetical protein
MGKQSYFPLSGFLFPHWPSCALTCPLTLSLQVFPEAVDPGDVVAQLECEFLIFNYS